MKTNDEILATWDTEGIYTDWYAIDSYDPTNGTINRLFVGTEDDAMQMMREYAQPTDLAMQPFHRCSLISESDAKAYFDGIKTELYERGVISLTEAAEMLGLSRQRVHVLLQNRQLDGFKVGNAWNVYRSSVEKRMTNG